MGLKSQNKSNAVMASRATGDLADPFDDYPSPPWSVRALMQHVLEPEFGDLGKYTAAEPACGRGHMAQALRERFRRVTASDIQPLGHGGVWDFLDAERPNQDDKPDFFVTNPPFKLAEAFIQEALMCARVGVAMLVRTVFIESIGRHERLFDVEPPTVMAQFAERVPMFRGRVSKTGSTATAYAWLVWASRDVARAGMPRGSRLLWIPPCRAQLERPNDYEDSFLTKVVERACPFQVEGVASASNR